MYNVSSTIWNAIPRMSKLWYCRTKQLFLIWAKAVLEIQNSAYLCVQNSLRICTIISIYNMPRNADPDVLLNKSIHLILKIGMYKASGKRNKNAKKSIDCYFTISLFLHPEAVDPLYSVHSQANVRESANLKFKKLSLVLHTDYPIWNYS